MLGGLRMEGGAPRMKSESLTDLAGSFESSSS